MIKFKDNVDILQMLKDKGYNTNELRKGGLLGENAIQTIRAGGVPGLKSIDKICKLLNKQPGQLLEYVPDNQENKTN